MLKCLAIDDEPLALRQIEKYIEKVPYLELVAASNNPLEAQRIAAIQPIDLMFVDINMPDLNGVDFVRSLITRPMIILRPPTRSMPSKDFVWMRSTTCSSPSVLPISVGLQPRPMRSMS